MRTRCDCEVDATFFGSCADNDYGIFQKLHVPMYSTLSVWVCVSLRNAISSDLHQSNSIQTTAKIKNQESRTVG